MNRNATTLKQINKSHKIIIQGIEMIFQYIYITNLKGGLI
jgi:hypothetical protein